MNLHTELLQIRWRKTFLHHIALFSFPPFHSFTLLPFHLFTLLPFYFFTFLLFSACTQDAYDKGEGTYSQMTAQLADAHVNSDKRVDYVDTDEGEHLVLSRSTTASFITKADTTYRVSFYYKMVEGQAEPITMGRVAVVSPKAIPDMKTDPVRMESMWIGKSKKYLNLGFYLMTGTTDSDDMKQVLGCRRDALVTNADGTHTLRLTLYHDQGGVPEYYSQRVYLSIPIQGIKADSVWMTVNTYNGQKTLKDCL